MKIVRLLYSLIVSLILILSNISIASDYKVIDWADLFHQNQSILSQENITQKSLNEYLQNRNQAAPNQYLSGQKITIAGFVVPLEYDEKSQLIELLLVPYYGACIHVPPPPKNQIIHVYLSEPMPNLKTMDMVEVSGILTLEGQVSLYGESDYKLVADKIIGDQSVNYLGIIQSIFLMIVCGCMICLGWFIGRLVQTKSTHMMGILLSFSAGTMLYLSFANVWLQINWFSVVLLIFGYGTMWAFSLILSSQKKLTYIALIIHNVPEIFIVFSTAVMNIWLGILITLLVSIHNVSLGFSLAQTGGEGRLQSKFRQVCSVSFIPVLIIMVAYWLVRSSISMELLLNLSLFSGGMLVYIAFKEVLPLAKTCTRYKYIILSLLSSFVVMFSLTLIL